MMQQEIQQRFNHAEDTIHRAAERCKSLQTVPMDLKNCVQQLDQRTAQVRQALLSEDEDQIRQCVDDLEHLGDRARDACESAPADVDGELKAVVMQAHHELSDLKHQLH